MNTVHLLLLQFLVVCKAWLIDVEQTFYENQRQCDLKAPWNSIFHHEFVPEACGCWIVYDIKSFEPICLEPKVINPY